MRENVVVCGRHIRVRKQPFGKTEHASPALYVDTHGSVISVHTHALHSSRTSSNRVICTRLSEKRYRWACPFFNIKVLTKFHAIYQLFEKFASISLLILEKL